MAVALVSVIWNPRLHRESICFQILSLPDFVSDLQALFPTNFLNASGEIGARKGDLDFPSCWSSRSHGEPKPGTGGSFASFRHDPESNTTSLRRPSQGSSPY